MRNPGAAVVAARGILWLAVAAVGGACVPRSNARTERPADAPPQGESACFYAREVENFRVVDRGSLVVYVPNEANAYLVRVSPPSSALRFGDAILFEPGSGQICGYAGERLLVGGARGERLAIIDVRRLPPEGD